VFIWFAAPQPADSTAIPAIKAGHAMCLSFTTEVYLEVGAGSVGDVLIQLAAFGELRYG
jgi:hypothetical protein